MDNNFKISYLEFPDGKKLISIHQHDYKSKEYNGVKYFIDGGQDTDFSRTNSDSKVVYKNELLDDNFEWVREQFYWTSVLKADGSKRVRPQVKPLKKISNNHLNKLIEWVDEDTFAYNMFVREKKYREDETNK